jgi:hypothetical protein
VLVVGGTVGGGIAVSAQQCVPPPDFGLSFSEPVETSFMNCKKRFFCSFAYRE